VTAAADGAVAWQALQERGADLVVSDVDMPRMDGFALTEAVRGSERFRDLPVVLVTARPRRRPTGHGAWRFGPTLLGQECVRPEEPAGNHRPITVERGRRAGKTEEGTKS